MPFVFLIRAITVIACVAAVACGDVKREQQAVDRDDFGTPIAFDRSPQRIVSLNPTTTEILFAIGAGDRVVGRSRWDSWPEGALRVQALGDGIRPNVEALLSVRPDLVLLYGSTDNRGAATRLAAAGVNTIATKIDSIDQFRRTTRLLGRVIGSPDRAARVVDSVNATLERVRTATQGLPRPTVFFQTWQAQIITIGGGSFLSELVEIAGGRNVYADLPTPSPMVTLEDVVRRDPDVVMASPRIAAWLRTTPAWQAVRAVREGRVLAYDTNVVGRPSVTLGMAAVNIAELLHPGTVR
jgi:iron complex transport system substrate-binding protein